MPGPNSPARTPAADRDQLSGADRRRHESQLGERINYAALFGDSPPARHPATEDSDQPGQMTIDEALANGQEDL
jgi:hypothetical protein